MPHLSGLKEVFAPISGLVVGAYQKALTGLERLVADILGVAEEIKPLASVEVVAVEAKPFTPPRPKPAFTRNLKSKDKWVTMPFSKLLEGQPSYPALTGAMNSVRRSIATKRGQEDIPISKLDPVLIGEVVQLTEGEFKAVRCTGDIRLELLKELLQVNGLSLGKTLTPKRASELTEAGGWVRPRETTRRRSLKE